MEENLRYIYIYNYIYIYLNLVEKLLWKNIHRRLSERFQTHNWGAGRRGTWQFAYESEDLIHQTWRCKRQKLGPYGASQNGLGDLGEWVVAQSCCSGEHPTVDGHNNKTLQTPTKKKTQAPNFNVAQKLYNIASSAFRVWFFVHRPQARSPKATLKFGDAGAVGPHGRLYQ